MEIFMKLVTFNIRYDCGQDGKNNFDLRKAMILDKIRHKKPDILCFQEVLPHVARWLKENLQGYYVLGCPRGEALDGEQTCVAFRSDGFNLIKMDTFWLSRTPGVPGSRYPGQSDCPRVCTELVLREFSSGQVFRLLNTHLDHESAGVRKLAAAQILDRLDAETFFPQIPTFLVGDMNAEPSSEEIQLLRQAPGFRDLTEGIGPTFHNFGRGPEAAIDYIFAKGAVTCTHVEKWTDCHSGVYLSDHYPICAEVESGGIPLREI